MARLEQALAPGEGNPARLARSQPRCRQQWALTLLFMNLFGVQRTWGLRSYTGDGLGLVTGRKRAYGYIHMERFLSELAQAGGAERLTDGMGKWTSQLWAVGSTQPEDPFYVDGHRKAVYADCLLPRGLVARQGKILGCRALTLLHDHLGHPLLALTDRGDQHLTLGLPQVVARYEQAVGQGQLARIVVDREGMGAAFLQQMSQQRTMITLLRTDQYKGLDSFQAVGEFVPLEYDRQGTLIREVAPAHFRLPIPDQADASLRLSVALVRDLRRQVPQPAEDPYPPRWDEDLDHEDHPWWQGNWTPTPAPVVPTAPKLIPVVCTAEVGDALHLAQTYFHRWSAQENSIRDFLIPLGLDVNHGYAKSPVENSEVARRRAALLKRLDNCQRWGEAAHRKAAWNLRRYHRLYDQTKAYADAQYRFLNLHQSYLAQTPLDDYVRRSIIKERQALMDTEIEQRWAHTRRASHRHDTEWAKYQRYCQEQRRLLRELETLDAQERPMYELDHAKDQIMTLCKLALANLLMWTRDRFFPPTYTHATAKRLLPFFHLHGRLLAFPDRLQVTLRPFNDRALNRDLLLLCQRVNQSGLRLPSGKSLIFHIADPPRPTSVLHSASVD